MAIGKSGMRTRRRGRRYLGGWFIALALLALHAFAATAAAAAPDLVLRLPDGKVKPGTGAAELANPQAVVASPINGHMYVSELGNARVSEYTAWGLFVRAWGWGVADGDDELQTCGPAEPQAAPPPSLCQQGSQGDGRGQLHFPRGLTIDPAGNVYVVDSANSRVQKFSAAGEFLLMFGGEVNKTKVEEGAPTTQQNVCPIAPTDICQAGTPGNAPSHFPSIVIGSTIAYSPTANSIVVGDEGRIQEFNTDGSFKSEIPFSGELEAFKGKSVRALDLDVTGNIYLVLSGTEDVLSTTEDVYKISPSGVPLDPGKPATSKFKVGNPLGVAVDGDGNVYVVDDPPGGIEEARVLEFDLAANKLLPTKVEEEQKEFFPYLPFHGPGLQSLATNICAGSDAPGNLYVVAHRDSEVAYVEVYGTPPIGCEPPPSRPPVITAQYAASVGTDTATVRVQINPRFFSDTTYYVEYGEGKCSEGGCGAEAPVPPALLTSKVLNKSVTSAAVSLGGLEPGTTYHYRFVSQSGGGGPVFGVDPDGEGPGTANPEEGTEGTLRTFETPSAPEGCPANEAFRGGLSGKLPDCRAYEMVSPLDKDGDAALLPSVDVAQEVYRSATSGARFTYSSITPFADPEAAPYVSQYMADRDQDSGWSSEAISPARSARPLVASRSAHNDYKAFSSDLCMGWILHNSASTLAEGAIPGFANLYRRDNCSTPTSYEALSTVAPPNRPASEYSGLGVMGFTADGSKTIFLAEDKLTEDAPALNVGLGQGQGELLLYIHSPSGLRFVCYLPSGAPSPTACGAGVSAGQPDGHASGVQNAISADGSRVFWTAYNGNLTVEPEGASGKVYVRINPDQEQSQVEGGECTEAERACTVAVSSSVSAEPAQYWGAADDGSKAIFAIVGGGPKSGNLYEFDVDTRTPRLIAEGTQGPMGLSEDASHVYFSSSKVLGEGASEGAQEGARNLYAYEAGEAGGSFRFIMALANSDFVGAETRPGAIDEVPSKRSAVVSADGTLVAFSSAASPAPTGYDNLDAESGEADQEVYLYDADAQKLRCVSCNPTGARPTGARSGGVWMSARLANPRIPLNPPRTLSADGKRLFFESHEALVLRDTNGTWDVYEWEAPGTGGCDEGDTTYGEAAEGCVDLISSGESPAPSRFLDADPSGADVFIGTQSSLVGADHDLNDVYDARVGGGFPEPPPVAGECEGEACQSPPAPPADITPASSAFEGPSNPHASKPKPQKRCGRGARKVRRHGKTHCERKRKRHHSRRAAG